MSSAGVGRERKSLHPDLMGLDQSLSTSKAPCKGDPKNFRSGYGKSIFTTRSSCNFNVTLKQLYRDGFTLFQT